MAIGRGSMTKELTGNRVKKKAMGGMAGAAGAADLSGRARGQAISAMAKQGGMGGSRPTMPTQAQRPEMPAAAAGRPVATTMKKGGKIDGAAKRGKTKGKMC